MKNYEVEETEFGTMISYTRGNTRVSFGEWEGNSEYAEYLRYTAWVEAGNAPEDFWTQPS